MNLLPDPIRGGRSLQHHQGVDRVDDRWQRLRARQGQPVDQQCRRILLGIAHKTPEAFQIHRSVLNVNPSMGKRFLSSQLRRKNHAVIMSWQI